MLQELIHVVVKRRADRQAVEEEWRQLADQPHVRSAKRFRRWLLAFLIFIGAAAWLEVVLSPGVMLRRHLATAGTNAEGVDEQPHQLRLPFGWMSDAERQKVLASQMQRIEKQLRQDHAHLATECRNLTSAWESLQQYSHAKLQVTPAVGDDTPTAPPPIAGILASQTTARLAWGGLKELAANVDHTTRDAQSLLDAVGDRFSAGSFLPEDDQDLQAMADNVARMRAQVLDSRAYVDHLCVLRREQAALARSTEHDQGGSLP